MANDEQLICPACRSIGDNARCPHDGRVMVAPKALKSHAGDPMLGTLFAGKYRVVDVIGQGGFGAVYRAVDETVGRTVAIKVIRDREGANMVELRARFFREAKVLGGLEADACVRLYEYGEDGGRLFIAMQFLSGHALSALIRQHGHLSEKRAVDLALQTLSGLAAAHALGLVHRDIKPDNIMVVKSPLGQDRVKILDFGIAKVQHTDAEEDTVSTQAGAALGSPAYMAPEQAQSDPTPQSDLYAMGIVLFEMLTGRRPFEDVRIVSLLVAHQIKAVPPHMEDTGITPALCGVVRKALEKKPADRWANAFDMIAALRSVDLRSDVVGMLDTEDVPPEISAEVARLSAEVARISAERSAPPAGAPLPVADPGGSTSMNMLGEVTAPLQPKGGRPKWLAPLVAISLVALAVGVFMVLPQSQPDSAEEPAARAAPAAVAQPADESQPVEPTADSAVEQAVALPDAAPVVTAAPEPPRPEPPPPTETTATAQRLDVIESAAAAEDFRGVGSAFRAARKDPTVNRADFDRALKTEARFGALRASGTWRYLYPSKIKPSRVKRTRKPRPDPPVQVRVVPVPEPKPEPAKVKPAPEKIGAPTW